MKYLGIDWGEKRIGLATGDSETKIASPFKVVGSLDEVRQIIKEEKVDRVIVGKPVKLSGDASKLSGEFNSFVDALKNIKSVKVELIDERLTSKAADALSGNRKTSLTLPGLRKVKALRDAVAAMLILQSYLDRKYNANAANCEYANKLYWHIRKT